MLFSFVCVAASVEKAPAVRRQTSKTSVTGKAAAFHGFSFEKAEPDLSRF